MFCSVHQQQQQQHHTGRGGGGSEPRRQTSSTGRTLPSDDGSVVFSDTDIADGVAIARVSIPHPTLNTDLKLEGAQRVHISAK